MAMSMSTKFDNLVENATNEKNTNDQWELIMKICDLAARSMENAENCLKAIIRRLGHQDTHVKQQALTLLDSCVSNCGLVFRLEIATPFFEEEFFKILRRSDKTVRDKLFRCVESWASSYELKSEPRLLPVQKLYHKLKYPGVKTSFETYDGHTDQPAVFNSQVESGNTRMDSNDSKKAAELDDSDTDLEKAIKLSMEEYRRNQPLFTTANRTGDHSPENTDHSSENGKVNGLSMDSQRGVIQDKHVGIFWDIENVSVPRRKSVSYIIAHLRKTFIKRHNHREFEFMVACDVTRLSDVIRKDINFAGGVNLVHVETGKNAADAKLFENIKKFVDAHSPNAAVVLISGDSDFVNDLRACQMRFRSHITLVHPTQCKPQFVIGWDETCKFDEFCSMVPDRDATNKNGSPSATQNMVAAAGGSAHYEEPARAVPNPSLGPVVVAPSTPKTQKRKNKAPSHSKVMDMSNVSSRDKVPAAAPDVSGLNVTTPANEKIAAVNGPSSKLILNVMGLPGKMGEVELANILQTALVQAGAAAKVKMIKNGQAFISCKSQENGNKAIEALEGNNKVFVGKSLRVSYARKMPLESGSPATPAFKI